MLFKIEDSNKANDPEPENEEDRKATIVIHIVGMLVSASLMVVGAILKKEGMAGFFGLLLVSFFYGFYNEKFK